MVRPWHVKPRSKYAWILAISVVFTGMTFAATTHKPHGQSSQPATQKMGTSCIYTAGPKAGTTYDYAPMQMPVDAPCNDGEGSTGVIIATPPKQTLGTICSFTAGPKTGTTHDFSPMHAPLNTMCDDGAGSSGTIVAAQPTLPPTLPPAPKTGSTGSICSFTAGPKAGTTHDYAPMHSPLDTACDDGAGSSGTIVAAPPAPKTGSICSFTAGPKAGTTHDYAPMHSPLNTACDDGAGSSGTIVATPPAAAPSSAAPPSSAAVPADVSPPTSAAPQAGLGSVCMLTAGPKAGTTYNFAPMQASLGAPCNYGADNTGVIIAGTVKSTLKPMPTPVPKPGTGTVCNFTSGPLALTTADFSPKRAPLGTPCADGHGSSGVMVEH